MVSVNNQTQKLKGEARKKLLKYYELRKQRGMSLLEVIIVLGIVGTIAAGVVVLAQRAFDARAITEVVTNTNTVRVAMKDAYQRDGVYPSYVSPTTLTADTIKTDTSGIVAAQLVQLGKISPDEARNNISGDFFGIGAATVGGGAGGATLPNKGYVIEVNGLSSEQCRAIISQVGNNWDYVQVGTSASGQYSLTATAVDMTASATGDVLRSLNTNGNATIDSSATLDTCTASVNSIILGSR